MLRNNIYIQRQNEQSAGTDTKKIALVILHIQSRINLDETPLLALPFLRQGNLNNLTSPKSSPDTSTELL